jgi:hypothetical protein
MYEACKLQARANLIVLESRPLRTIDEAIRALLHFAAEIFCVMTVYELVCCCRYFLLKDDDVKLFLHCSGTLVTTWCSFRWRSSALLLLLMHSRLELRTYSLCLDTRRRMISVARWFKHLQPSSNSHLIWCVVDVEAACWVM